MRKIFTTIFFSFLLLNARSQNIDSIKYEYGHLYYRTYGKGEPIILLSGGPGNVATQLECVARKLGKQYQVILFEQRGTGLSIPTKFDSSTINLRTAISDLNLLMNHLKLEKAIFLGHSYGSSLAMIYASQFPQKIKSLILIAPGYFGLGWTSYRTTLDNMMSKLKVKEKARLFQLIAKSQSPGFSNANKKELDHLKRLPYIFDKSTVDSLMPLLDGHSNDKTFRLMLADAMSYQFDFACDLKKITAPIHLICGKQDFLSNIAYDLKEAKPSIALYWIERSGHFPMHEQPTEFYGLIDRILGDG